MGIAWILLPSGFSFDLGMRILNRESCFPNCDLILFFHMFFIVFCWSGTECLWTQYCNCFLPVRDRLSFELGTRGTVLPQLSFGHLSLLSEWWGDLRLAVREGWSLVNSLWELVTWGQSLFLHKIIWQKFTKNVNFSVHLLFIWI